MKDGVLVEHWDVIEDEATREQSKSGNPMFGDASPPRMRTYEIQGNNEHK